MCESQYVCRTQAYFQFRTGIFISVFVQFVFENPETYEFSWLSVNLSESDF